MKRKTFVRLAVAGIASLSLPQVSCKSKANSFVKMLASPAALLHICNAQTINTIGESYRQQSGSEREEADLVRLISVDQHGKTIPESAGSSIVASLLAARTQDDFQQNKTVIVDGWVLSLTEARQCALFSITQK